MREVELLGAAGLRGDVTHEHLVATAGGLHDHGGAAHVRQGGQCGIDLAELDAPPADLHLVVHAPHEVQAVRFEAHVVAGAVGAIPAEFGHGGELFGVLGRVEVAGQTHSADNELTGFAHGDRLVGGVHDRQVPAAQRQANGDRRDAVHRGGAGHHRGLGGAVGVPQFAPVGGEPGRELGWAGLAAEDEQPYRVERFVRPQACQRRHGRDHGDAAGDEPRAQVHTAAH